MNIERDNQIEIKQVDNGFVVKQISWEKGESLNKIYHESVTVIEEDDENECITSLLYKITELLGIFSNNYSNDNLNITWDKKGRKVE